MIGGITMIGDCRGRRDDSDNVLASIGQAAASQRDTQLRGNSDSLLVKGSVASIGVVDENWFTRECISRSLKEFDKGLETIPFKSGDECLHSEKPLDLIVFHAHQLSSHNHNVNNNDSIKSLNEIAPVIILSEIDNPYAILKALESGARGYIPTATTSLELTIEIIRLVRAGGIFVPASSLSLQMNNGEGSPSKTTTTEQFTPRQMAVLHYLKLGKANKIIAHELALSEGTVKAHIRNIMKKMGVTNRTEVACRAQALPTFGTA